MFYSLSEKKDAEMACSMLQSADDLLETVRHMISIADANSSTARNMVDGGLVPDLRSSIKGAMANIEEQLGAWEEDQWKTY